MFEGPKGTSSESLSPGDFLLAMLPLKAEDQFWLPSDYANGTQVFEHLVWHRLRHSQNLLWIKVAMVGTSQGDISEKPCWVEWQICSVWSLLSWPSPSPRSPEECGKHVFEESFKLFLYTYMQFNLGIIKCWACSEGVLGTLLLHSLQCYCFCSVLSGVCSGLPQNTSAFGVSSPHITATSFSFQSELSEKSHMASRLSRDFKKCFKYYPSHYPRLVLA